VTVQLLGVSLAEHEGPDSGGVEEGDPVDVDLDTAGTPMAQDVDYRLLQLTAADLVQLTEYDYPRRF
jgi:hypothetical protein